MPFPLFFADRSRVARARVSKTSTEFNRMQAAIEIPTPNDSDSDTVATALEAAAIFSAKGDTAEALRWVQRAAESRVAFVTRTSTTRPPNSAKPLGRRVATIV